MENYNVEMPVAGDETIEAVAAHDRNMNAPISSDLEFEESKEAKIRELFEAEEADLKNN